VGWTQHATDIALSDAILKNGIWERESIVLTYPTSQLGCAMNSLNVMITAESYEYIQNYAADNKISLGETVDSLVRRATDDQEAMDIIRKTSILLKNQTTNRNIYD
jgi:hypothetical protein